MPFIVYLYYKVINSFFDMVEYVASFIEIEEFFVDNDVVKSGNLW